MARFLGSAAVAALLLAACDNGPVKFPGVDPKPKPPSPEPVGGETDPEPITPAPSEPSAPEPEPPAPEPEQPTPEEPGPETPEPEETEPEEIDPAPAAPPPPAPPPEPTFSFRPAGALVAGSGTGSQDQTVYAPDMVFPIENAPAYPQSQVWGWGGGVRGGDQCDARNYAYPWRDNFCETRSSNFSTPTCPVERVHLGQDIRVGTPADCNELRRRPAAQRTLHKVVAAEDGVISNIGSYTVTLRAGPRIYRYLHLNMRALQVSEDDVVTAGQHLGYVSNDFGGTPTTFHLHFEIRQNLPGTPWAFVPPYTSLVASYARREGGPGEEVPDAVGVASAPLLPPPGMVIVE